MAAKTRARSCLPTRLSSLAALLLVRIEKFTSDLIPIQHAVVGSQSRPMATERSSKSSRWHSTAWRTMSAWLRLSWLAAWPSSSTTESGSSTVICVTISLISCDVTYIMSSLSDVTVEYSEGSAALGVEKWRIGRAGCECGQCGSMDHGAQVITHALRHEVRLTA